MFAKALQKMPSCAAGDAKDAVMPNQQVWHHSHHKSPYTSTFASSSNMFSLSSSKLWVHLPILSCQSLTVVPTTLKQTAFALFTS